MMKRSVRALAVTLIACGALSAPALAGGADQIRARIAGFRQLGAAYKAVTDGVRANDLAKVRQAANQIVGATRSLSGWFPRGSGPQPGVKTATKAEVWTHAGEFRGAANAFSLQALALQRVAAGSDMGAIRSEARKLGATCKGCHDGFRVASD